MAEAKPPESPVAPLPETAAAGPAPMSTSTPDGGRVEAVSSSAIPDGGPPEHVAAAAGIYGPDGKIVELSPHEEAELLTRIDVAHEALVRFRKGRHPNPAIDQLLARHFPFDPKVYSAPAVVQIVCTVALILAGCSLGAVVIFTAGSLFNFTEFLRVASLLLADFIVMMLVAAAFMPLPWFDEIALARDCARQRDEVLLQLKR